MAKSLCTVSHINMITHFREIKVLWETFVFQNTAEKACNICS